MIITVITIIILKRFGGWDTKFELPFGTITGWPDSQPAEKGLGAAEGGPSIVDNYYISFA